MSIDRLAQAASLGYLDAKTAIQFYQTDGLPLSEIALFAARTNLIMDWGGILYELQMQCGMSKDKAQSVVEETKRIMFFIPPVTFSAEVQANRVEMAEAIGSLLGGGT